VSHGDEETMTAPLDNKIIGTRKKKKICMTQQERPIAGGSQHIQ
jgi:hypothetical protein